MVQGHEDEVIRTRNVRLWKLRPTWNCRSRVNATRWGGPVCSSASNWEAEGLALLSQVPSLLICASVLGITPVESWDISGIFTLVVQPGPTQVVARVMVFLEETHLRDGLSLISSLFVFYLSFLALEYPRKEGISISAVP